MAETRNALSDTADYDGVLIGQPFHQWSDEQRLALLDWHPLYTGRCPNCEMPKLRDAPSVLNLPRSLGWCSLGLEKQFGLETALELG